MDEPSSSLSSHEAERLFAIAWALRDQGVAILYISHRFEEIFEIADRVTVFRDGEHISTSPIAEVTKDLLTSQMVDRDMQDRFERAGGSATDEVMLRVEGLGLEGAFEDVDLEVRKGENICLSGLVGARRTDVALALFGIAPADRGRIEVEGRQA